MENTGLYPIVALGGDIKKAQVKGSTGKLMTLPIRELRVDDSFQRAVSQGSVRNIRRICETFDWSKFLPVIVVRDRDFYSIVDGQHRTTAALTLGIETVPCYVLECSPEQAASAFAAINGNVTPVGPVDIWFAELKAKAPEALRLQLVLDAASVRITRKKGGHRVGETRSVNVLRRALEKYGPDLLTTILQCITETGEGNPGMIFGAMVNGIGNAVRTKRHLLNEPTRLFDLFDNMDLPMMHEKARVEFARTGNPVQAIITREINFRITAHDKRLTNAA